MARPPNTPSKVIKNRIRVLNLKERYPELKVQEISNLLQIPYNTVKSIVQRWKYPLLAVVKNKKGAGRPRLYTERWKRAIVRRSQAEPFWSARRLAVSVQENDIWWVSLSLASLSQCRPQEAKEPFEGS